jgi:hypothetical protein
MPSQLAKAEIQIRLIDRLVGYVRNPRQNHAAVDRRGSIYD